MRVFNKFHSYYSIMTQVGVTNREECLKLLNEL
jgi:hypothetical protein